MTPNVAPATPQASGLLLETPPDRVFLPLVVTAARIFTRSLPDAGEVEGQVERRVAEAFNRAVDSAPAEIAITLRYLPPTLVVSIAAAKGEAVVLHFAVG